MASTPVTLFRTVLEPAAEDVSPKPPRERSAREAVTRTTSPAQPSNTDADRVGRTGLFRPIRCLLPLRSGKFHKIEVCNDEWNCTKLVGMFGIGIDWDAAGTNAQREVTESGGIIKSGNARMNFLKGEGLEGLNGY